MHFRMIYPTNKLIKEKELILNSPKRKALLKDGIPTGLKCDILGRGAYGTVFKAKYRERQVAVKIIKDQSGLASMCHELYALNLQHKNIVKLLKVEWTLKCGLVIMETFPGQCLQQILETQNISLLHKVRITLDVIAALRYCHEQKLLHMDVKPQNILVCYQYGHKIKTKSFSIKNYTCKLCDFGCAVIFDTKTNKTDTIKGTLRYMSPEALKSKSLSPACDVFSLGITMWQLAARRLPYYWINCNETVAYQVVKYNLRPDAKNKCLHEIVYSSEFLPAKLMQNIRSILNKPNDVPISNRSSLWSEISQQPLEYHNLLRNSTATHELEYNSKNFVNTNQLKTLNYELLYACIYKSCWQSDAKNRLNLFSIEQYLKRMLKSYLLQVT